MPCTLKDIDHKPKEKVSNVISDDDIDEEQEELFDQIGPNEDVNLCILSYFDSVSTLYGDFDNHEVVGGVVMTFIVTQSTVLENLGNMNISHEWDYLGGLRNENVTTIHVLPNSRGS
ncbi:hypothetical protein CTI12_AA384070 [Artemisia annua]|uniref:Uncharacterized protein n=1 Tax=Artemisia annua TaxID=35608 RepID=A0A2U1MFJ9_ARTAN|nr:hypothetical protein CTI12_AA384070 [Artemisia annua]